MKIEVCERCGVEKCERYRYSNQKTYTMYICKECRLKKSRETRLKNVNNDRFIYILVDPRDSRIYYVGQTHDPKQRLLAHHSVPFYEYSEKDKWTRKFKSHGVRLQLVIIETVTPKNALEREVSWIRKLGSLRAPLMNRQYFHIHKHIKHLPN